VSALVAMNATNANGGVSRQLCYLPEGATSPTAFSSGGVVVGHMSTSTNTHVSVAASDVLDVPATGSYQLGLCLSASASGTATFTVMTTGGWLQITS
jgi:hypothetical protein